ncbi:hypothetical protein MIMGU_mgv1a016978mg [Erythranthe guttata]|uniref:Uncharacterized protein n=1 Tax=Erythranthe guttata TaxID=4155 RepID=A0A022QVM8_ERYGU|nr:hypothetical protein MIMGU_mgv1a016978mg [Erythranthe guttata]
MDYQQQEQRQQQYNPFQLVDDFFLQDDLSYGQYYLQPPQLWYQRQQEEVFLPQPQQQQYNDRPWGAPGGVATCMLSASGDKRGAEASEYLTGLLQNFI